MGSTPISSFQSLPKLKGGQRTGVICREIRGEHGGPGVLRISGLWGLIIRLALTAVGQPPGKDFGGDKPDQDLGRSVGRAFRR